MTFTILTFQILNRQRFVYMDFQWRDRHLRFHKSIYICVSKINKYLWDYVNDDGIFKCVIWHPLINLLWFCLYFVLSGDWDLWSLYFTAWTKAVWKLFKTSIFCVPQKKKAMNPFLRLWWRISKVISIVNCAKILYFLL